MTWAADDKIYTMMDDGGGFQALNWIAFCQNGKDNSAAKDDYVCMYCVGQCFSS
jgi:hypothetical protein